MDKKYLWPFFMFGAIFEISLIISIIIIRIYYPDIFCGESSILRHLCKNKDTMEFDGNGIMDGNDDEILMWDGNVEWIEFDEIHGTENITIEYNDANSSITFIPSIKNEIIDALKDIGDLESFYLFDGNGNQINLANVDFEHNHFYYFIDQQNAKSFSIFVDDTIKIFK